MTNMDIDDTRHETDEDAITKRLNKAFESRLDLDRVCIYLHPCLHNRQSNSRQQKKSMLTFLLANVVTV